MGSASAGSRPIPFIFHFLPLFNVFFCSCVAVRPSGPRTVSIACSPPSPTVPHLQLRQRLPQAGLAVEERAAVMRGGGPEEAGFPQLTGGRRRREVVGGGGRAIPTRAAIPQSSS